ncbi:hypothetical protein [Streptomyces sp. NPDC047043]|uniref:hypothetical protein n=1 Tax=Streptomyces sp. NPDC047043 TaxID=3154497 RepID=UPI0034093F94
MAPRRAERHLDHGHRAGRPPGAHRHNRPWDPVTVPVPAPVRDVLSAAVYDNTVPPGASDMKALGEERP